MTTPAQSPRQPETAGAHAQPAAAPPEPVHAPDEWTALAASDPNPGAAAALPTAGAALSANATAGWEQGSERDGAASGGQGEAETVLENPSANPKELLSDVSFTASPDFACESGCRYCDAAAECLC